jgi:hypothetical protein
MSIVTNFTCEVRQVKKSTRLSQQGARKMTLGTGGEEATGPEMAGYSSPNRFPTSGGAASKRANSMVKVPRPLVALRNSVM